MNGVFGIEGTITLVVFFVLLAVKVFALVSALLFSSASYQAADKLSKPAWGLILAVAIVLQVLGIGGTILSLVGAIAAFVYLADVRPALAGLKRR